VSFVHGKDIDFQLDDSGGTLRLIKIYLDRVTGLPGGRGLSEVTAFGDGGTKSIPSLQNCTFQIGGSFDSTATSGVYTVLSGLRTATATATFKYGPEGSTAGKPQFTGECWMTEFTVDASVKEKVPISATFQVDGTVTLTTY
jgi:hypothetical protein